MTGTEVIRVMMESNTLVNSRPLLSRVMERDREEGIVFLTSRARGAKAAPGVVNRTHKSPEIRAGRVSGCRVSTLSLPAWTLRCE